MNHPNQPLIEFLPRQQGPDIYTETLGYKAVVLSREAAQATVDADWVDGLGDQSSATGRGIKPQNVRAILETLGTGYNIYVPKSKSRFRASDLGRQAVSTALRHTADSNLDQVGNELDAVRQCLLGMTEAHSGLIDRYFSDSAVPSNIRRLMHDDKTDESPTSGFAWLSQEDNNAGLLTFLEWHVGAIEEQQADPQIQTAIEHQKADYSIDVLKGIMGGWLHTDADAAVKAADDIKVYIGDVFDSTLEYAGGYHTRGTDRVIISGVRNGVYFFRPQAVVANVNDTSKHEFNHAVLGRLDSIGGTWMDEALTEHIVQAFECGQPDVMHPDKRAANIKNYAYDAELRFMSDILSEGAKPIAVEIATRAYSEKGEMGNYKIYLKELINKSWARKVLGTDEAPVDFLEVVTKRIESLTEAYKQPGMNDKQAQALAVNEVHQDLLHQPAVFFSVLRVV